MVPQTIIVYLVVVFKIAPMGTPYTEVSVAPLSF